MQTCTRVQSCSTPPLSAANGHFSRTASSPDGRPHGAHGVMCIRWRGGGVRNGPRPYQLSARLRQFRGSWRHATVKPLVRPGKSGEAKETGRPQGPPRPKDHREQSGVASGVVAGPRSRGPGLSFCSVLWVLVVPSAFLREHATSQSPHYEQALQPCRMVVSNKANYLSVGQPGVCPERKSVRLWEPRVRWSRKAVNRRSASPEAGDLGEH